MLTHGPKKNKKIDFDVQKLACYFFSKLSPQKIPRDCGQTKGVWPARPKTFEQISEDIFRSNFKNMLIYFFVPKKNSHKLFCPKECCLTIVIDFFRQNPER